MGALSKRIKHNLLNSLGLPLIAWTLRLLCQASHPTRLRFGRVLALLLRLSASSKRIIGINLSLCFPELSASKRQILAQKNLNNLGLGVMEAASAWLVPQQRFDVKVTFRGLEHIERAQQQKQGVLLLGLHMGCTELIGRLCAQRFKLSAVYQPAKHIGINQFLYQYRKPIYHKLIANTSLKHMIRDLRLGATIWYAPDHAIGQDPVFAPFFGIDTATTTATMRLAKLGHANIIPIYYYREHEHYYVDISPPLADFPSGDDVQDATRINEVFEAMIRQHPEQYLWHYKRFKKAPSGKTPPY